MARAGEISPLGLYTWDNHIFDLFVIPEALDKNVLIENLLAETAELEVLYPNPVVLKNLIGVWSHKNLDVWNRLYETTQYEYNPIENYNRYETGSEDGSDTTTHGGTDSTTGSVTHGGSDTTSGQDGHWIAGFDAPTPTAQNDGLVKKARDERNGTINYGGTVQQTGSTVHGETIETEKEGSHSLHAHGNIGVTTTQKLIREQRDIDLFNLYDIIIHDFKMRFCILVY